MKKNVTLITLVFVLGLFVFSGILNAAGQKLPDLGMYGFLKLGKFKKQVKWNQTIILTPADATLISNGTPAFEVYYSYREYQRVPARDFKNKVYFNGKVVSIQSSLSINAFQIKHIHTQAYLGPQDGTLQIKIDADNEVRESREDNNFGFYVKIKFRGFSKAIGTPSLPAGKPCGVQLDRLSKIKGYPGDTFVMYGKWGKTQGTKIPFINKGRLNRLIVLRWTPKALHVKIPRGLTPGGYRVGVYCNDLSETAKTYGSNTMAFTILKRLRRRKLPDLKVTNIGVVRGCYLFVTIKNVGNAGVPDSHYNNPNAVGIQMYNGGKPWGGMILSMFDPEGKLKIPGGQAVKVWFRGSTNLKIGANWNSIKVVADHTNKLAELREDNNTLTKRLACGRK